MTQFLQEVVGARKVDHDHVVCGAHEINLKKSLFGDPYHYARCCEREATQGTCRHYPPRLNVTDAAYSRNLSEEALRT